MIVVESRPFVDVPALTRHAPPPRAPLAGDSLDGSGVSRGGGGGDSPLVDPILGGSYGDAVALVSGLGGLVGFGSGAGGGGHAAMSSSSVGHHGSPHHTGHSGGGPSHHGHHGGGGGPHSLRASVESPLAAFGGGYIDDFDHLLTARRPHHHHHHHPHHSVGVSQHGADVGGAVGADGADGADGGDLMSVDAVPGRGADSPSQVYLPPRG